MSDNNLDPRETRLDNPTYNPRAESQAIAARIEQKRSSSNPGHQDILAAVERIERTVGRLDEHVCQVAADIGAYNGGVRDSLEAWRAEANQSKTNILKDRLPDLADAIVSAIFALYEADKEEWEQNYVRNRVLRAVSDGFNVDFDGDHKTDGEVAVSDEVASLVKALTASVSK